MMSEVCKAQTNDLKTLLYVLVDSTRVPEAKIFPRPISNSVKRKTRRKSLHKVKKKILTKNRSLTVFTEWAGLALPTYKDRRRRPCAYERSALFRN